VDHAVLENQQQLDLVGLEDLVSTSLGRMIEERPEDVAAVVHRIVDDEDTARPDALQFNSTI
jgi:hypothetical protein